MSIVNFFLSIHLFIILYAINYLFISHPLYFSVLGLGGSSDSVTFFNVSVVAIMIVLAKNYYHDSGLSGHVVAGMCF